MGILFLCEKCSHPLNIKVRLAGKRAYCPSCEHKFTIPHESEITESEYKRRQRELKEKEEVADAEEEKAEQAKAEQPQAEQQQAEQPAVSATPGESHDMTAITASEHTTEEYQAQPAPVATQEEPKRPAPVEPAQKFREVAKQQKSKEPAISEFVAAPPGAPAVTDEELFSETDKSVWYVRPPSGGQFGPATGGLMKQWAGEGRITEDSYIWQEGWEDWKVAGEVIGNLPKSQVNAMQGAFDGADGMSSLARNSSAYKRRQRRRTMWGITGLIIGSIIVVGLIVTLIIVIQQM